MRGGRLPWFGHFQRRDANNIARRVMNLTVLGTRRRGHRKKTWHQQIKDDMMGAGVTYIMALDRNELEKEDKADPYRETPSR